MLRKAHSLYVVLSFGAAILSFYKLWYLASKLSSEDFGLYSIIILSFVYIGYVGGLGANEYMLKLGAMTDFDEKSKILLMRNNAIFYGLSGVIVVSLIVFFTAHIFFSREIRLIAAATAALALLTLPYNIFESYYRAIQSTLIFSGMLFSKAVFVVVGVHILADDFGVEGVLISEMLALAIIIGVCFAKNFRTIILSGLERPAMAVKEIIRNGFYVSLSNILRNISLTADRYIVTFFLGVYSLGVYSFVMIIYQGSVLFSGIVMNIFGPYLVKRYKSNGSRRDIAFFLFKVVSSLALISVLAYPLVGHFIPVLLEFFFKNYNDPEVHLMLKLIYIASVASFFIFLLDWFFVCVSKEYFISALSLVSFLLILSSALLFQLIEMNLKYYVVLFMAVRVLIFFVMAILVFRSAGEEAKC